jgi:hypothetical protein
MLCDAQSSGNYRFCLGGSGHRPHRSHTRCVKLTVSSPPRLASLRTRLWPSGLRNRAAPAAAWRTPATKFLPRTQPQILCSIPFSSARKNRNIPAAGILLGAANAFRNLNISPRSYLTPAADPRPRNSGSAIILRKHLLKLPISSGSTGRCSTSSKATRRSLKT